MTKKVRKRIIQIFSRNTFAKIICVLLAFFLWVWVASNQNTVAKFPGTLPIQASNLPPNLAAIYDIKEVEIKILAEPVVWQKLSADTFSANINLAGLKEGTHEVPVNVTSSIAGVQVIEKTPETILVSLEPVVEKEVRVIERIEGQVAEGLVPGDIVFSPEKVKIRGAKSIVTPLTEAVAVVILSGESVDFSKTVTPLLYDDKNQQIADLSITPSEVSAAISVVRGSNTKTVGVKVVISGSPKDNYYISNITSTPGAIDISGVRSTVLNTRSVETVPIDVTGATEDIVRDVDLFAPESLTILNNPAKVHVVISIKPIEVSRDFEVSNFKVVSNGSLSVASTNPGSVKFTATGPVNVINSVTSGAFTVVLDLSNQQPDGNNEITLALLPASVQAPDGISLTSLATTSIKVKVK